MSRDLLSDEARELVTGLRKHCRGPGVLALNAAQIRLLVEAFDALAPEPPPPSLEEELFLAEGLYCDNSYAELSAGVRAQYERQAAAMRARGAK